MKASANINMTDWQDDESLIKMDSHAWAPQNEGDSHESSNCAVVGYSYQSFLEENLFVSLARPSDIIEIERQASLGKRLHAMSILQFAECHLEVLQVLLADGIVTSEPFCGFSLPHVALLHIGAGNPDLSGAICMYLVRNLSLYCRSPNMWFSIRSCARNSVGSLLPS